MKTILKLTVVFLMLSQTVAANDFKKIYNRMYIEYLNTPSKTSVETLLGKMNENGSFKDINYAAKDGSPRKHIQNLIALSGAYASPESAFYSKEEVKSAYMRSLNFWIDTDNQATNWWYRYIPYPKELSKGVILMSEKIKQDKTLFDKTIKYLQWSYDTAKPAHMTGANLADIIMGSIAATILTENDAQMMIYKSKMTELLTIQPVEGVQPDYLYAQHCGNGRQLYFTNYGKEFVNSMMYYLEFCNSTKYQSPGVDLLQDLFINGVQWIFYSKHYDPNNAGRYNSSEQYYAPIKELADRLQKLKVSKKDEIKAVYKRISGENSLSGNRMFWRFDYMINRRANYYVSTRMSSTRTVGAEAGNGDGEFNYYLGNGTNYLFVTGKEYDGTYFKKFNNRQFPGITAEQDNDKLPIPDWGEFGNNGNAYAGGVSDSTYGACAMILDRRELKAHKAWFYFDDEFICLGAGITRSNGKADVYTTLNQTNYDGKLQYSAGGKTESTKEGKTLQSPDWMLYGSTTYFNLQPKSEFVVVLDTALFSLNVNHGKNPQNGSYAYLVKPGMNQASDADKYKKNIPVIIISNTSEIQAVEHIGLNLEEVIFYKAGTLKMANGDALTVDAPCAVLWNRAKNRIHVANPLCESANPASIALKLVQNKQEKLFKVSLPNKEFSGKSVVIKL
jgi:chondroitin AC lyase